QRSDADRERVVLRAELRQEARDGVFVFADQCALGTALFGVAKRVQGRASEELQPAQYGKNAAHPRAKLDLARLARLRVDAREERRREVVDPPEADLQHAVDLLAQLAVAVQPGDLVLVLVGEQLRVVARHRLGELAGAGLFLLHAPYQLDQRPVLPRIAFVL